jgi:hypothetical protein
MRTNSPSTSTFYNVGATTTVRMMSPAMRNSMKEVFTERYDTHPSYNVSDLRSDSLDRDGWIFYRTPRFQAQFLESKDQTMRSITNSKK